MLMSGTNWIMFYLTFWQLAIVLPFAKGCCVCVCVYLVFSIFPTKNTLSIAIEVLIVITFNNATHMHTQTTHHHLEQKWFWFVCIFFSVTFDSVRFFLSIRFCSEVGKKVKELRCDRDETENRDVENDEKPDKIGTCEGNAHSVLFFRAHNRSDGKRRVDCKTAHKDRHHHHFDCLHFEWVLCVVLNVSLFVYHCRIYWRFAFVFIHFYSFFTIQNDFIRFISFCFG